MGVQFCNGDLIFLGFETENFASLEPYPERIESGNFFILLPLRVLDWGGSDSESLFGQFFHIWLSDIVEWINIAARKGRVYIFVLKFRRSQSEKSYFIYSNLRLWWVRGRLELISRKRLQRQGLYPLSNESYCAILISLRRNICCLTIDLYIWNW